MVRGWVGMVRWTPPRLGPRFWWRPALDWPRLWPATLTRAAGLDPRLMRATLPRVAGAEAVLGTTVVPLLLAAVVVVDGGRVDEPGWLLLARLLCGAHDAAGLGVVELPMSLVAVVVVHDVDGGSGGMEQCATESGAGGG